MSATITIDGAGRLVLPKGIREQLHLRAGSRLRVEIQGDGVRLQPEADADQVRAVRKGKRTVLTGIGERFDAVDTVKRDREDRVGRVAEDPGKGG